MPSPLSRRPDVVCARASRLLLIALATLMLAAIWSPAAAQDPPPPEWPVSGSHLASPTQTIQYLTCDPIQSYSITFNGVAVTPTYDWTYGYCGDFYTTIYQIPVTLIQGQNRLDFYRCSSWWAWSCWTHTMYYYHGQLAVDVVAPAGPLVKPQATSGSTTFTVTPSRNGASSSPWLRVEVECSGLLMSCSAYPDMISQSDGVPQTITVGYYTGYANGNGRIQVRARYADEYTEQITDTASVQVIVGMAVSPPTGLVVSTHTVRPAGEQRLDLSWTNTDATAQTRVYRGGVLVATVAAGVSAWSDGGLVPGVPYTYQVRHLKNGLEGGGPSASGTTLSDGPDAAPATLTATTPAGPAGETSIALAWTKGDTTANTLVFQNGTLVRTHQYNESPTWSVYGLAPATTYTFELRHVKGGVETAGISRTATTLADGPDGPPLSLSAYHYSNGTTNLFWYYGDGTSPTEIHRDGVLLTTLAAGVQSYTYTDSPGTFAHQVRHVKNGVASAFSNTASVTVPPPPPAATLQSVSAVADGTLRVQWTNGSSTGASLQVSTDGTNFATLASLGADIVQYDHTSLGENARRWYRVQHTTAGGTSTSNAMGGWTWDKPDAAPSWVSVSNQSYYSQSLYWSNGDATARTLIFSRPAGGSWSQVGDIAAGATSYTATGLTHSQAYEFHLRHLKTDNTGASWQSNASPSWGANTSSAPTLVGPTAPSAPAGETQLQISWSPGDGRATISANLYRVADNGLAATMSGRTGAGSHVFTGLAPSTQYRVDLVGTIGAETVARQGTATTLGDGPDAAIAAFSVTPAARPAGERRVELTWTNADPTAGTNVYRNGTLLVTQAPGVGAMYDDVGLAPATTYAFELRHVKGGVETTGISRTVTTLSDGPDAAIAAFTAAPAARPAGERRVDLAWTNGDATASTNVYRNGALLLSQAPGVSAMYNDAGLAPATTYTFELRHAKGGIETAGVSRTVTTWSDGPDAAPAALSVASSGGTGVTLAWTNGDATAATDVYRDGVRLGAAAAGAQVFTTTQARGTTAGYQVRHVKNGVESALSNTASLTLAARVVVRAQDTVATVAPNATVAQAFRVVAQEGSGTFALGADCGAWTSGGCTPSLTTVTLVAGQEQAVTVTYTAPGPISGPVAPNPIRLIATMADGVADTGTTRTRLADVLSPVVTLLVPGRDTVMTHASTGSGTTLPVRVEWCDPDGSVAGARLYLGQTNLGVSPQVISRPQCATAYEFNGAVPLWLFDQVLTAQAWDAAGHYTTVTRNVLYAPPMTEFRPEVTPEAGVASLAAGAPGRVVFQVRNAGLYQTPYAISADCGGLSGCTATRPSLTLAPGASDTVAVSFTAPATGAQATIRLAALFDVTLVSNAPPAEFPQRSIADTGSVLVAGAAPHGIAVAATTAFPRETRVGQMGRLEVVTTNTGLNAATVDYAVSCQPPLVDCGRQGLSSYTLGLAAGAARRDTVSYRVTADSLGGTLAPLSVTATVREAPSVTQTATAAITVPAATYAVTLASTNDFPTAARQGTTGWVRFRLRNTGEVRGTLDVVLACTAPFTSCVREGASSYAVTLAAGEQRVDSASYQVPADATPEAVGGVTVRAVYREEPAVEATAALAITVLRREPVVAFTLRPDPATVAYPPGEPRWAPFLLTNRGEDSATFQLTARVTAGFGMPTFNGDLVRLAPGETRPAKVSVTGTGAIGTVATLTMTATHTAESGVILSQSAQQELRIVSGTTTLVVAPKGYGANFPAGGGTFKYAFDVTNNGVASVTLVDLVAYCPASFTVCRIAGAGATTQRLEMRPGERRTVQIEFASTEYGRISLQARLVGSDPIVSDFANADLYPGDLRRGVAVTPDAGSFQPVPGLASAIPFAIRNTGIVAASYEWSLRCEGQAVCPNGVGGTTPVVEPGDVAYVDASFAAPGAVGAVGKLVLQAWDIAAPTQLDSGSINIVAEVPPVFRAVAFVPRGSTVNWVSSNYLTNFQVLNQGNAADQFDYTVTCEGAVACAPVSRRSGSVAAYNGAWTDTVSVQTSATPGAVGYVRYWARSVGDQSKTATMTWTVTLRDNTPVTLIAVAPKNQHLGDRSPGTTQPFQFTIQNPSTSLSDATWTLQCLAPLTCPGQPLSGTTPVLGAQGSYVVSVAYVVPPAGQTGTLRLVAQRSNGNPIDKMVDTGMVTVRGEGGSSATIAAGSINAGRNISRDECLTIAAGDDAAYECGDLRVVHALPATTTMNKTRAPTLIYNSAHAQGRVILHANASTTNTSVTAMQLTVSRRDTVVATRTVPWEPAWSTGVPRRMAIPVTVDSLKGGGTQYVEYTMQIRPLVGITPQTGTDTSGSFAIVDRRESPYGSGWWIDGLEQLLEVDADRRLWVGGDGSTRLYRRIGTTTTFTADTLDRIDLVTHDAIANEYTRWLRNRAHVVFNGFGEHIRTVNAQGHVTTFSHKTLVGEARGLRRIVLPMPTVGDSARQYLFDYRPVNGVSRLDSVTAPSVTVDGSPVGRATKVGYETGTGVDPDGRVRSIRDPDLKSVSFGYDGGRITRRTNKRGHGWEYAFDAGLLRTATLTDASLATGSIVHTFCAAEGLSLSACGGSTLALADSASTLVDGPRGAAVGDTTRFWVNRYGAPTRIRNAKGLHTTFERRDARFPQLVTALTQPNGRPGGFRTEATYTDRGLVETSTAVSGLGDGVSTPTRYTWDLTWDRVRTVTSPTNEVTTFRYDGAGNRQAQLIAELDSTKVTYTYDAYNRLETIKSPSRSAEGVVERFEYDSFLGNLRKHTSAIGYVTTMDRDDVGRIRRTVSPAGRTTDPSIVAVDSTAFDIMDRPERAVSFGRRISGAGLNAAFSADSLLLVVTTHHDDEGNPLTVNRSSYRVDAMGAVYGAVGTSAFTEQEYDAAHRVKRKYETSSAPTSFVLDAAGNVEQMVTPRGTITAVFDNLDRMTSRTVPASPTYPVETACDDSMFCASAVTFPYGGQPLTIPAETSTFVYDDAGRMIEATNADARVRRGYYPNGLLRADSLELRRYDRTAYETPYVLGYGYDQSGRRTSLTHPSQLCPGCTQSYGYNPITGLLESTSSPTPNRATPILFSFGYDGAGRARTMSSTAASLTEIRTYDDEDRLATRNLTSGWGLIYDDQLSPDARGKVYLATVNAFYGSHVVETEYSGLGAMIGQWSTRGTLLVEELEVDALANVHRRHRNRGQGNAGAEQRISYTYESGKLTGMHGDVISMAPAVPAVLDSTFSIFDQAGNLVSGRSKTARYQSPDGGAAALVSATWQTDPNGLSHSRSYYGVDNKLRHFQRLFLRGATPPDTTTPPDSNASLMGASGPFDPSRISSIEEYRYDALGRRVLVRLAREPQAGAACTYEERCVQPLTRTIWDGDQILWELRTDGRTGASGSALEQRSSGGDALGEVMYVHAGGIDQPLVISKAGEGDFLPHASWRGTIETASRPDGSSADNYTWPGRYQDAFFSPDARFEAPPQTHWFGSLVSGKTDGSGQLYMRNRYYDPKAGRFTQEDPIGIGGGLNLYGFAAGDPVNYSDPLGLCPECRMGWGAPTAENAEQEARYYAQLTNRDRAGMAVIAGLAAAGGVAIMAGSAGMVAAAAPGMPLAFRAAQDPRLQNTLNALFRAGDRISGGTAGAIRREAVSGQLVGGKPHLQKGIERASNLERLLRRNDMSHQDVKIAQQALQDLRDAISFARNYKP
ncbi:MAG TPA: RHS repeat-associated core domain-containing protein [Gemmatimonadaceae bacterium]|nr:RHS repeat-associated core domain-containing protein [Gemmatimonadaceae bacterium]